MREKLIEPSQAEILRFCAADPIERVFLEDVARRGLGRFAAATERGEIVALCHVGANVVPSGRGCDVFAPVATRSTARMLIGEAGAVLKRGHELGPVLAPVERRLMRLVED